MESVVIFQPNDGGPTDTFSSDFQHLEELKSFIWMHSRVSSCHYFFLDELDELEILWSNYRYYPPYDPCGIAVYRENKRPPIPFKARYGEVFASLSTAQPFDISVLHSASHWQNLMTEDVSAPHLKQCVIVYDDRVMTYLKCQHLLIRLTI